MKLTSLCTIALAVLVVSCESRDVVTGRARVTSLSNPAIVKQTAVKQPQVPVEAKAKAPKPEPKAPLPSTAASQKQPELAAVQQPAPVANRPEQRTATSQVQPAQRVLTPQSSRPVKKKRVLMPGQNRGLMAR